MVFITLKLIVFFKKFSEFSNFKVSVLFCVIVTKFVYELVNNLFLVNYKLLCFIWRYFDFVIKICFLKRT